MRSVVGISYNRCIYITTPFFFLAFPEIGLSLDLRARLPRSTRGWSEVTGWTDAHLSDTGRFLFGAPLANKASRFSIPKSGIYFVSFSVRVAQADTGLFQASFIINGQIDKSDKAMTAVKYSRQGDHFSLLVSGFMDLRSSDYVSVYVYSEKDTDWVIEDDSQFSLRYSGSVGSFPAFSAIKHSALTLDSFSSSTVIRNWETSGSVGLFVSLAGFSSSTGEFVPICDGIYFVAANIRVQARPGLYKLYLSVNGERLGPSYDENVVFSDSIFTMNLHGSFYLKAGDTLALMIKASSSDERLTIHSNSGFSVSFVDVFNQSSLQGVSTVIKTTNEIPGVGWMEITTWSRPSIAHVQFYNPDVFQNGRFTCSQGGMYYVSVSYSIFCREFNNHAGLYLADCVSEFVQNFSLNLI